MNKETALEPIFVGVGICIWIVVLVKMLKGIRCPNCRSKLKLDSIKSPTGINISKKLILTLNQNSDQDSLLICSRCNKKYLLKNNSKKLDEM